MKAGLPTRSSRSVRLAADLALVGSLCAAIAISAAKIHDAASGLEVFGNLWVPGGWVAIGIVLRAALRGLQSHWYWLYLTVFLPVVLGGGAFAAFAGTRWGFPITGWWLSDVFLWACIGCHSVAGGLVAHRSSRAAVIAPASEAKL